jgi:hypothetical protein
MHVSSTQLRPFIDQSTATGVVLGIVEAVGEVVVEGVGEVVGVEVPDSVWLEVVFYEDPLRVTVVEEFAGGDGGEGVLGIIVVELFVGGAVGVVVTTV